MKKALLKIDGIIVHCAHTEIAPIDKLKPYPRNNKNHPDAQIAMLAKIIKAQGWRAPITVSNQTGYVVRGHARLEAAKRLGLKMRQLIIRIMQARRPNKRTESRPFYFALISRAFSASLRLMYARISSVFSFKPICKARNNIALAFSPCGFPRL